MAKEVSCAVCSFRIRTDDDSEMVSILQTHAKSHHNKNLTADGILGQAKSV
jgi:predicted small metal-binding protein